MPLRAFAVRKVLLVVAADHERRVRTVSDDRVEAALDPQLRDTATARCRNAAASEALVDDYPREQLEELALLPDGAAALLDAYDTATWPQVFDMLRTDGPEAVIDRVRELKAGEPDTGGPDVSPPTTAP